MIGTLIAFAIAFIAATLSFREARSFVRKRLRFVDSVQSPMAPILAGVGATFAVALVAMIPVIPFISFGTALSVGVATGMGVAAGAKDAKNGYYIAD